jgi:hypothetical protein
MCESDPKGRTVTERALIHIALHIIMPGVIAWLAFTSRWRRAWLIMILTMIVDMDHLLATRIYDPNRCGIGFHPLHTLWAIAAYLVMMAFPKTRLVGCGLVVHMALDAIDCVWMSLE